MVNLAWQSSYGYALQLLGATALAVVGRMFPAASCGGDMLKSVEIEDFCPLLTARTAYGVGVYFLGMVAVTRVRPALHHGYWLLKNLALLAALVGSLLLPSEGLVTLIPVSAVASSLFLIVEQLVMLDFILTVNDFMKGQAGAIDGGDPPPYPCFWTMIYLGTTLAGLAAGIAGLQHLYVAYGTCPIHMAMIALTTFLSGILAVSSTCNAIGKGAVAGVAVFCNNVYLCWGAMVASSHCPSAGGIHLKEGGELVLALAVAGVSLAWTSHRSATWALFQGVSNDDDDVELGAVVVRPEDEDSEPPPPKEPRWWPYHLVLSFGGFYVLMLLTQWEEAGAGAGLWAKMIAQWFSSALFLWIMCAPKCFPNRDFS